MNFEWSDVAEKRKFHCIRIVLIPTTWRNRGAGLFSVTVHIQPQNVAPAKPLGSRILLRNTANEGFEQTDVKKL